MAAIAVGEAYGVAKKATAVAVKVFAGNRGLLSDILAGIDFVIKDHISQGTSQRSSVINMSFGGPTTQALDQAVNNTEQAGITFVVAAGNTGSDACALSPGNLQY